jgi:hypothetical protein
MIKAQKDFEFNSPLSVQEALDRIKDHSKSSEFGGFYGQVEGNHFFLHQNVGPDVSVSYDDPQMTGYIVSANPGCRVFARARIDDKTAFKVYGGIGFLLFCFGMFKLLGIGISSITWSGIGVFILSTRFYIFIWAFIIALYFWRKFETKGRPDAMQQLKRLLNADLDQKENKK